MPDRNHRKRNLTRRINVQQRVYLRVDETGNNFRRKVRRSRDRQQIGKDRAVVPTEMTVRARAVFPRVAPVGPRTDNGDRSMRDGGIASRRFDEYLAKVSRSKQAKPELRCTEVIQASGQRGGIPAGQTFCGKIPANNVEFDFVKRASASRRAEKCLPQFVLLAACDASREKQKLRESFEIGDGMR